MQVLWIKDNTTVFHCTRITVLAGAERPVGAGRTGGARRWPTAPGPARRSRKPAADGGPPGGRATRPRPRSVRDRRRLSAGARDRTRRLADGADGVRVHLGRGVADDFAVHYRHGLADGADGVHTTSQPLSRRGTSAGTVA